MVGYKIYILICDDFEHGDRQIRSIHETFDGVQAVIDNLYDYYNEKGYVAKHGINGTLNIYTYRGAMFKKFYVSDRTLEK